MSERGRALRSDVTGPVWPHSVSHHDTTPSNSVYRRHPTMSQVVPAILYPSSLLDDMDTFYEPLFDFDLDPKAVSFPHIIVIISFLNMVQFRDLDFSVISK